MQVQFDPLLIFRRSILAFFMVNFHNVICIDRQITHISIFLHTSARLDPLSRLQCVKQGFIIFIPRKLLDNE